MTITTTPSEVRPGRRVRRSALLILLALPALAWAVVRLFGWEHGFLVQLVAFTPYAAAWSLVPLAIALLTRTWPAAAVAALATVLLAVAVLPRAVPDRDKGPATGVPITVMTVNMFIGAADPAAVVRLVREHDVSVLAVQEFTPESAAGLSAAGLDELLPHHALADEIGTTGSGLYSRFPLTDQGSRRGDGGGLQDGNLQAYATIQPPGAGPVFLESAHPLAPYALAAEQAWRSDLEALPRADQAGPPKLILGDFNSTLDHAPLRETISHGYRDAAAATGKGLIGTWGPYDGLPIPPVTLDHILVDKRIGVRETSVHSVSGSDHRALVATVTLPATA
ncbi:endonuclease [Paractinoplanes abujensis]|uniref:Endonuclease/exonuclease/phosphatase family metal-dependent hydrolase n=1 Tax=Paractinoplanes abujensis TaxID=882441 RepID=A0A7W7D0S8_9ACTN|nr:endonuclease/exonuclease/phosphatase family protein [Actinoplanes abujensis]MBB4697190.1 endonuclease/exonuclease/phosphatase family metal-dependent hydrolase [Actinoplanes abujensis]GID18337.1 endonuclease [Actinoplanes abujensis]